MLFSYQKTGTCKMRNEIETKRGKFRFFSVNFVSIYFVSFRFHFAFYMYTHKDAVFQWCLLDSKSNWHNFHNFSSFYLIFSRNKNRKTNQLHVFNPTKLQRELPLTWTEGGSFLKKKIKFRHNTWEFYVYMTWKLNKHEMLYLFLTYTQPNN